MYVYVCIYTYIHTYIYIVCIVCICIYTLMNIVCIVCICSWAYIYSMYSMYMSIHPKSQAHEPAWICSHTMCRLSLAVY